MVIDQDTRQIDGPDSHRDKANAFTRFFRAHYGPVRAYAARRHPAGDAGSGNGVDDVVAEVFLVAWRRWDEVSRFEPQLPWLYRVAANVLRNSQRAGRRHLRLVDRATADRSDTTGSGRIAEDATDDDPTGVLEALATLTPDDQEVLRLVTWEGLTHQEAAIVLECSPNAVTQRLKRARERLATALDPTPDSEELTPTKAI